jgi:hypothetical protein
LITIFQKVRPVSKDAHVCSFEIHCTFLIARGEPHSWFFQEKFCMHFLLSKSVLRARLLFYKTALAILGEEHKR